MRKTHLIGLLALGGAIASMGFGCSSDPEETGQGGAGGGTGGGATTGTMVTSTTTTSTGGTGGGPPDESTSCDDAVDLEELENGLGGFFYEGNGVINPAMDADYFKYTAAEGEWLSIITDANPDDDDMLVDTVVGIYSEDGSTKLGEIDDAVPRVSTDSEMFFRVPAAGTYCIKVEEFSGWDPNSTAEGDPTYLYRLAVVPTDFALYDTHNLDMEANDTPATAQEGVSFNVGMTGQYFTQFSGVYDADGDKDVYKFTAPAGAQGLSNVFMPLKGVENAFGSTVDTGVVNIWADSDLSVKWASLDATKGSDGMSSVPIVPGEDYYLEMNHSGAPGANPFYFMKFATTDTINPQEMDDTANNDTAQPAVPQPSDNTNLHFVGGNVPGGDVDWWSVAAADGDTITVVCSSRRVGSGVGAFTVGYYGENGATTPDNMATAIAPYEETETEVADILWTDSMAPNASKVGITVGAGEGGTHYFKISAAAGTDIADVASKHYLCGLHVTKP